MVMKYLSMFLLSVVLLTSCMVTPSSNNQEETSTYLEVSNNSGNVDFWFINYITVGGTQLYSSFSSDYEIRHGEKVIFSFTKEDVGGDLNGLIVDVQLQRHNQNVQTESEFLTLDFKLGEKRVVRIDCTKSLFEICTPSGLALVSDE